MAARRKRDFDIAMGVAQLIVLAIFAAFFVPSVRHIASGLGIIAASLVAFVVLIAIGTAIIRRVNGLSKPSNSNAFSFSATPWSTPGAVIQSAQTTTDLTKQLRNVDWFQFEKLIALLYRRLGYNVTRRGGANPDGGIDLILEKDGQRVAVQCKQWRSWNVGVKPVREFLGALTDAGIKPAIFITLCGYTGEAKQLADKHGIELVDESDLAKVLEHTGAECDPEVLAILKDTRKFCPKCEREMLLRTAKKGIGVGQQFWGCSAYPKCRFTMPTS